jgi:hypothetical protein
VCDEGRGQRPVREAMESMMSFLRRVTGAVGHFFRNLAFLIREVWGFMRVRKRYWMAPFFVVLLLFGLLIAFVQNAAVAQFIYTLF